MLRTCVCSCSTPLFCISVSSYWWTGDDLPICDVESWTHSVRYQAVFHICCFISIILDSAAKVFERVHIFQLLPFDGHMRGVPVVYLLPSISFRFVVMHLRNTGLKKIIALVKQHGLIAKLQVISLQANFVRYTYDFRRVLLDSSCPSWVPICCVSVILTITRIK